MTTHRIHASTREGSIEDMFSYKDLQDSLSLLSLPPTIDRTLNPRTTSKKGLAICILGSPKQYLDVLLEGGDCCPGNMLLILHPSWLEKIQGVSDDISLAHGNEDSLPQSVKSLRLSVHKAITFDRGGTTFLDMFQPPRRVTYFINEMPEGFDAMNVDCALNGSSCVKAVLNNRLLWMAEMSRIGATIPPCLVFCKGSRYDLSEVLKDVTAVKIVDISKSESQMEIGTETINAFLSTEVKQNGKVVMEKKINGLTFRMVFEETQQLVGHILEDLPRMICDDYIIIEIKEELKIKQKGNLKWKAMSKGHDLIQTRVHVSAYVTVCRGLDDQLRLSQIYASLTSSINPSSYDTYHTLETTLRDLGITDGSQVDDLRKDIDRQATAVMKKVVQLEKMASTSFNTLYIGPRTDFLEFTFDFQEIYGTLTPVLQDARSRHTNLNVEDNETWTRTPNYAARSIIHVMVMRSHSLLLKDKWILILSTNIKGREDFWIGARKYGVKVVLVTPKAYEDTKDLVDVLIVYDLSDRSREKDHAKNILRFLKDKNLKISGCIAMTCFLTMLAAMIRKQFEARGPSAESGNIANEKYLTYSTLLNSSSHRFTSKSFRITNVLEMVNASKNIDFPAFVKLECGVGAIGAAIVSDENECVRHYQGLIDEMNENRDVFELDSRHNSVILTEYFRGSEHNIDVVMFDGQLIVAFIRDVSPPNLPSFVATANVIPSNLPRDKQMTLIRAAVQCCKDIGLTDGVFNVEMRLAPDGPKLLEINPRISVHALIPLIKQCYDEDLIMLDHLINCGIRPTVVHLPPFRQAYTLFLRSSQHIEQLTTPWISALLEELNKEGMILYRAVRDLKMTSFDKVIACVVVVDEDAKKAKQTLLCLSQALGLDTPGFHSSYFLDHL